jgi:hypothetical protein
MIFGKDSGKNRDHAHDGTAVMRKSLDFLDLSAASGRCRFAPIQLGL